MGEPINQISVTQCFDRVDAHFESLIVPGEWQGVAGRDLHTVRKLGAELVAISLRLRQILSTTGESDGRSSNAMNIALSAGAAMATERAPNQVSRAQSSSVNLSWRSEVHTSEFQTQMRISYAVYCLKQNNKNS